MLETSCTAIKDSTLYLINLANQSTQYNYCWESPIECIWTHN